jgi:hypothetical protein
MWEEDPRYQEANHRFAIFLVLLATISVAVWSAWTGNWSFLGYWAFIWAAIIGGLVCYDAGVWLVCHSLRFVSRLMRRLFQKGSD